MIRDTLTEVNLQDKGAPKCGSEDQQKMEIFRQRMNPPARIRTIPAVADLDYFYAQVYNTLDTYQKNLDAFDKLKDAVYDLPVDMSKALDKLSTTVMISLDNTQVATEALNAIRTGIQKLTDAIVEAEAERTSQYLTYRRHHRR